MNSNLKIFCDFDGTVTQNDVWIASVSSFIKKNERWHDLASKFEKGEIGTREFIVNECSMVEDFDLVKFNEIIEDQKIDPYFKDFLGFCEKNSIQVIILSEGMDYYIDKVLKKHGIDTPYFANKIVFSEKKKSIGLGFPYLDSECLKCGCCKRNLLLNMTGDDEISIYIGDEFSDGCAAEYADIVFAKKTLASYCWKNNITYFEYMNFLDIKNKLEKILAKKNLKHRQTARFKRREVFLRG
jgi:2-hydroxy-3-keto-5-methylthiopentenyl-1-phosphate phosphatase